MLLAPPVRLLFEAAPVRCCSCLACGALYMLLAWTRFLLLGRSLREVNRLHRAAACLHWRGLEGAVYSAIQQ
jgi:hypothetical protein